MNIFGTSVILQIQRAHLSNLVTTVTALTSLTAIKLCSEKSSSESELDNSADDDDTIGGEVWNPLFGPPIQFFEMFFISTILKKRECETSQ
jgi:hypothetical protein